jgi:hypothetical protein
MFSKIIFVALFAVLTLSFSQTPTTTQIPAGVMNFQQVDYEANRDRAMQTNRPYTAKILAIAEKNATDSVEQQMVKELLSFFNNPSSDHYLYQMAYGMVKLSYDKDSTRLVQAVIDWFNTGNNNLTKAVITPKNKTTLSTQEIIRRNAKNEFHTTVTDSAMKQIFITLNNAKKDQTQTIAPSTTTSPKTIPPVASEE